MPRDIKHDLFGAPIRRETINSKNKGDSNERVASKWLTLWTGVPFTRVPSSGGMRWKNTVNACGDVVCEDQDFDFMFAIETKAYKSLRFDKILSTRNKIFQFFLQAEGDAVRANKKPMLMVRSNGQPKGEYMIYFMFEIPKVTLLSSGKYGKVGNDYIYGYNSRELLQNLKYKELVDYLANK